MPDPLKLSRWLCLGAGTLDFCTGLGLVAAPALLLRLMGVPPLDGDGWVFLRFVGAFVAAVGAVYLWTALRPAPARVRALLEFTLFFRFAAGAYAAAAILTGTLHSAWSSVPATDFALVALQAWLLARWPRTA